MASICVKKLRRTSNSSILKGKMKFHLNNKPNSIPESVNYISFRSKWSESQAQTPLEPYRNTYTYIREYPRISIFHVRHNHDGSFFSFLVFFFLGKRLF